MTLSPDSPDRYDRILHIDGHPVDFSPPVLDPNGESICTCTFGAMCLSCYETTLHTD